MHGKGELFYEDGRTYKGGFQNDLRDGLGIYTWSNGKIYDGGWSNGK